MTTKRGDVVLVWFPHSDLATFKRRPALVVQADDLIETGLEAQEREKRRFFDLADRLARSSDPEQQKQLKEDLARMTFGE